MVASAESPKVAPPATTVPTSARLEFRAQPPTAQLFLDGQRLASNPVSIQLPINGTTHQLRAEAPGYAVNTSDFLAQRDSTIEIVLTEGAPQPAKTSPESTSKTWPTHARPTPVTGKHVASPASAAPVARQGVGCQQQAFFVDIDGIKKLRPECL